NRQKECVQMPGRWPDQTLDQAFGLPEGSGRRPHLASVLQEGRENAIIAAGLGFIWRISAKGERAPVLIKIQFRRIIIGDRQRRVIWHRRSLPHLQGARSPVSCLSWGAIRA